VIGRRLPRWVRWTLIALAPIFLINSAVMVFGSCAVFPLSPFFLREKLGALGHYARHRPGCLFRGHPDVEPLIARAESRHRLPPGLLASVVEVESNTRCHRISPAGAMGLGQIAPATARTLGLDDPFDPADNLDASARYLSAQLASFHDLKLALAAYNAGPGSIVNRTIPRNGETPAYVDKVLRAYAPRRAAAHARHRP
jgi:soluble lytic murein transglycosylase-like protein